LPSSPLLIALFPVCLGILADRQWLGATPFFFEIAWCLAAIALLAWFIFWKISCPRPATIALLASLFAAAGLWHHVCWNFFGADDLGRFATESPEPICCEVVARSAPQAVPTPPFNPLRSTPLEPQSRLLVDVVELRNGADWQAASGRARLSIGGSMFEVHAGDRLRIFGHLSAPSPAANPGDFDFAQFARGQRELSMLRVKNSSCIQLLQSASPWKPTRWLDSLRAGGERLLEKYIPRDHSGLAAAVLLGEREQVDEQTSEAFLETGTIHILCIAGLHIGIVAVLLFALFGAGWLPRRTSILCVMGILAAYMVLTMSRTPVLRATTLVWIICGGLLLGRNSLGWNSLALAGLIVLAINPTGLFHIGVQLSFLAVAAIFWVAQKRRFVESRTDPLDRLIAASRPWPWRAVQAARSHLWEMFVVGAAMWAVITPLTMARFHILAPAGLVLNLLFIPVLVLVVTSGIGVLAFGWWLPPLAMAFGRLCDWSLNVLETVAKWTAEVPGARFWVAGPSDLWLTVFYFALAMAIFFPRYLPPVRWQIALVTLWCGVGLLGAAPLHRSEQNLRCTFVAVGHGGAALLEFPDGHTLLYDAGRLGSPAGGAQSISDFLWSRNISHLDAVVLSHSDTDHYNSLPGTDPPEQHSELYP
jgi:competence protein ComEC